MPIIQVANCSPYPITVTLNSGTNPIVLDPSSVQNDYVPFFDNRPRTPHQQPAPGEWGNSNLVTVQFSNGQRTFQTQVYTNVPDPSWAISTLDVWCWVFWNRLVFSQGGAYHDSGVSPISSKMSDAVSKEIQMGNAYIVNCTPFGLNFIVNSGNPTKLGPMKPTAPGTIPGVGSVASIAYTVPYSSGLNPDQISGTNNPSGSTPNSLIVTGPPYTGGQTPNYQITVDMNQVPLTSDVYLWVLVDNVYGTDSAGRSQGFTIVKKMSKLADLGLKAEA